MATKKKPAKAPTTQTITIKVPIKKSDAIVQGIKNAEKANAVAALAPANNSDLCKIWLDYGGAFRFVVAILPGIGNLKKIKKGLLIIADAIETNCNTPLEPEV